MEYESDLEELIQSDLHSEMNKILDQSDTTATASSNSIVESLQKPSLPKIEEHAKIIPTCSETVEISNEVIDTSQTMEAPVQTKEDVKLFLDESQPVSEVKTETSLTEFSGRFSLERFPVSSSHESPGSEQPSIKTEQNELSNLGWLRCVDVQPLQCCDTSLPGIEQIQPNTYQVGAPQMPLCMSEAVNAQSSGPPFCAGQLSNPPPNVSYTSEARSTPRYTPIQPNTNLEGHQRYLMHQRGVAQQSLLPFGDHMGAHRYGHQGGFRPYPPPPYGTSGSAYAHDGYHHSRYQNQTQKIFPKPVYSYSCLIAMSLRASKSGCLPVSDIYNFMMENFPYFKTAPDGWKNSVRHNLSLNKCFEKVEKPNGSQRKGCLWALNPAKISKMEEEVQKWKRKDPDAIRKSMSNPEELDRELEEIRRSDEEAARRRMLSMTTHGLSVISSPHGYHPYSRHNHSNPSHTGHMHPSGTSSLPTTPHHYHQHRPPYRPSMGPGHGMNASPSSYSTMVEDNNHKRHPRQLFNYPVELRNYPQGSPDVSSTPTSSIKCGRVHDPNVASQMQNPSLSSPYSSSSSSGNASFFGALVDSVTASGNDLNDIDLDSSLADLSAFQGSLWEDHNAIVPPQTMVSDVAVHPFDDHLSQAPPPHPRMGSSSSMSALEHATTSEVAPEANVFEGTPRFGGDHSYFNGNNKTVMLH